jgi:hypothetical protein
MATLHDDARNLAAALLAGPWSLEAILQRGGAALGGRPRWLRPLVQRMLRAFPEPPAVPHAAHLPVFLAGDRGFRTAWERSQFERQQGPSRRLFWVAPCTFPSPWAVPSLATTTTLAGWLGLVPRALDWFADCRHLSAEAPPGPLRHYTYCWLPSRHGKRRLLEQPKCRLKGLQRRLLHDLLDLIPPHESAHGYRRGRSIVSYAGAHVGQRIVLRFDLKDFFPSIRASRVHALFASAGYPREVARALTGLCTSIVPPDVLAQGGPTLNRALFAAPHLPQGAPTSPALANLCAYRLDCRLSGLARKVGARYTRYADDLAFSGGEDLERCAHRIQVLVCRIALDEGLEVNPRKSRFMRCSTRQQLAGIVVNDHPNYGRAAFDRLKAILVNCARHGPAGQNRDGVADFRAHLAGRIGYVAQINVARGRKLRALFERIDWGER